MLTDTTARNAKSKEKSYKIADSGGLYLLVKPTGKYWRMDYRFAGKRKTLAIGVNTTVIPFIALLQPLVNFAANCECGNNKSCGVDIDANQNG